MKNKLINYFKKCLECGNKTFKISNEDNCPFYACRVCCSYIYKYQSRFSIYGSLLYSSNYFDGCLILSAYLNTYNCKVFYFLRVEDFSSIYYKPPVEYRFESLKDLFKFQKKLIDYRCLE